MNGIVMMYNRTHDWVFVSAEQAKKLGQRFADTYPFGFFVKQPK